MLAVSDFVSGLLGSLVGGALAILGAYLAVQWQTPKAVEGAMQAYRQQQEHEAAVRLSSRIFPIIEAIDALPSPRPVIPDEEKRRLSDAYGEEDPVARWWRDVKRPLDELQREWRGDLTLHIADSRTSEAMTHVGTDTSLVGQMPPNESSHGSLLTPVGRLRQSLVDLESAAREVARGANAGLGAT